MEAMLHDLEAAVDLLETMADDHPAAAAFPSAALSSQLKPPPPPPPKTKTVKMVRMEEGVSRSATKHKVSHEFWDYRVSNPIVREILSCFVLGVPLPCLGSS